MEPRKQAIIHALQRFIRQRPGMDPRNYDYAGYRQESRQVTKDRHHAETLLAAVAWRDGITADDLIRVAGSAFSGRLTILLEPTLCNRVRIEYCTGQYFPTEYRKAVAAVCASALWAYQGANMPAPKGYRVESWAQLGEGRRLHTVRDREEADAELTKLGGQDYGSVNAVYLEDRFMSAGDWLRAHFRREFGRSIAERYFR
jgi:hypothetical protein